jgi:hypothetical protein
MQAVVQSLHEHFHIDLHLPQLGAFLTNALQQLVVGHGVALAGEGGGVVVEKGKLEAD